MLTLVTIDERSMSLTEGSPEEIRESRPLQLIYPVSRGRVRSMQRGRKRKAKYFSGRGVRGSDTQQPVLKVQRTPSHLECKSQCTGRLTFQAL